MSATRRELAWLGDRLGGVRDIDVLSEGVAAFADELAEGERIALAVLLDDLAEERLGPLEELRAALSGERYSRLAHNLTEAAIAPPVMPLASSRGRKLAPSLIARPWQRLRDCAFDLGEAPSDRALHRLRIRAKELRYASESLAAVGPARGSDLGRRAKKLQTVLGLHHDAVTMRSFLRQVAGKSPEHAFASGLCMALSLKEDDRDSWRKVWAGIERPKLTAFLDGLSS